MKIMQYMREDKFRSKHRITNQNYRQISALIEKENMTQQKFDQIRNVKYRNRKEWEMWSSEKCSYLVDLILRTR